MNEEEYIQEELAKSKARHPAFRGKIKLSNPDFNQFEAGDINEDQNLNVQDAILLINLILNS